MALHETDVLYWHIVHYTTITSPELGTVTHPPFCPSCSCRTADAAETEGKYSSLLSANWPNNRPPILCQLSVCSKMEIFIYSLKCCHKYTEEFCFVFFPVLYLWHQLYYGKRYLLWLFSHLCCGLWQGSMELLSCVLVFWVCAGECVCKFLSIHFWMSPDTALTPQTKQHDNCSLEFVLTLDMKMMRILTFWRMHKQR